MKVPANIKEVIKESLRDWFKKEKWVRISSSGKIAGDCGTSKNKKNPDRCLPKAKAQSLTKGQRAATAAKKKKAGSKGKTVVKNTKKATVKKESKYHKEETIQQTIDRLKARIDDPNDGVNVPFLVQKIKDLEKLLNEDLPKMPTQDQVDKFFASTQNKTHYLNSKPVAGQEKTFNKMKVEPWDEYDLSNFNSLVRKAKSKGQLKEAKQDIYDKFLENPSSPKGRAKSLILKFTKEYGDNASSMAVDRFASKNNLKPEEKYILKFITKNDIKISSQPGGPDFSAVKKKVVKELNTSFVSGTSAQRTYSLSSNQKHFSNRSEIRDILTGYIGRNQYRIHIPPNSSFSNLPGGLFVKWEGMENDVRIKPPNPKYGFPITKNPSNLEKIEKSMGGTDESLKPQEGLWANINAKKKAGKKSSHKNSNAYKDAKKAGTSLEKTKEGVTKEDIRNLVVGTIYENTNENTIMEKDDRCTRLAKSKYDTWPSAYASGAVVRCRRGEIWKKK